MPDAGRQIPDAGCRMPDAGGQRMEAGGLKTPEDRGWKPEDGSRRIDDGSHRSTIDFFLQSKLPTAFRFSGCFLFRIILLNPFSDTGKKNPVQYCNKNNNTRSKLVFPRNIVEENDFEKQHETSHPRNKSENDACFIFHKLILLILSNYWFLNLIIYVYEHCVAFLHRNEY